MAAPIFSNKYFYGNENADYVYFWTPTKVQVSMDGVYEVFYQDITWQQVTSGYSFTINGVTFTYFENNPNELTTTIQGNTTWYYDENFEWENMVEFTGATISTVYINDDCHVGEYVLYHVINDLPAAGTNILYFKDGDFWAMKKLTTANGDIVSSVDYTYADGTTGTNTITNPEDQIAGHYEDSGVHSITINSTFPYAVPDLSGRRFGNAEAEESWYFTAQNAVHYQNGCGEGATSLDLNITAWVWNDSNSWPQNCWNMQTDDNNGYYYDPAEDKFYDNYIDYYPEINYDPCNPPSHNVTLNFVLPGNFGNYGNPTDAEISIYSCAWDGNITHAITPTLSLFDTENTSVSVRPHAELNEYLMTATFEVPTYQTEYTAIGIKLSNYNYDFSFITLTANMSGYSYTAVNTFLEDGIFYIVYKCDPMNSTIYSGVTMTTTRIQSLTATPKTHPVETHVYLCDNNGGHLVEMEKLDSTTWGCQGTFADGRYSIRYDKTGGTVLDPQVKDAWFKFYTKADDPTYYVGAGEDSDYTDQGTFINIYHVLTNFYLKKSEGDDYYHVEYENIPVITVSFMDQEINSYIGDMVTMTALSSMGYITASEIPVIDKSDCVKYTDLNAYSYVSATALNSMAYVSHTELDSMAYITMADVSARSYVNIADLNAMSYVSQTALSAMGYVTAGEIPTPDLTNCVKYADLNVYAYVSQPALSAMSYVDNSYLSTYMNNVVGNIESILQTI